jgi:phosphohistidine phosphatase
MKKIILMQHGSYLSEEQDPEKGLSEKGKEQVELAASMLNKLAIQVDLILTSSKKRSMETGQILENTLHTKNLEQNSHILPKTPALDTITYLQSLRFQTVLIAGHLPSIKELGKELCGGDIDFENGSIAMIETEELTGSGCLKWFITPKIYEVL